MVSPVYIAVCTDLCGTTGWDRRRVLPCGGLTSLWIHVFKRSSSNRKFRSYSGGKARWRAADDIHCHECHYTCHNHLWNADHRGSVINKDPTAPADKQVHYITRNSVGSSLLKWTCSSAIAKGHGRVHLRLVSIPRRGGLESKQVLVRGTTLCTHFAGDISGHNAGNSLGQSSARKSSVFHSINALLDGYCEKAVHNKEQWTTLCNVVHISECSPHYFYSHCSGHYLQCALKHSKHRSTQHPLGGM